VQSTWEIDLEQLVILPGRSEEPFVRTFIVVARTEKQAVKSVKDAGHRGKVVTVRVRGLT